MEITFSDSKRFEVPYGLLRVYSLRRARTWSGREVLQVGKKNVEITGLGRSIIRRPAGVLRWSQHGHLFVGLSV